jgi:hypothetical protein
LYHTIHQPTFMSPCSPAFLELSNHDSSGYFLVAQFYWCPPLRKLAALIVLAIFGDAETATIFTYIIHSSFCCTGSCILQRFFFQKYTIFGHLIALMSTFLFPKSEQVLRVFCVSLKVSCIVVSFRNVLCTVGTIKGFTARHSEENFALLYQETWLFLKIFL